MTNDDDDELRRRIKPFRAWLKGRVLGQHTCSYGLRPRSQLSYLALHPDDDDVDEGEDEDEASSSGQPTTLKDVLMTSSAQLSSDHIRSCSDGGGDSSQASSMMQD